MWAVDPHRKQQRISSASLFLQCSPLCLTWSLESSPGSFLSRRCSGLLSESFLCLDLGQNVPHYNNSHNNTDMWLCGDKFWRVLGLNLLLTHGAVLHEVANLATDAAAAVVRSHFSLSENFGIEEVLLQQVKINQQFQSLFPPLWCKYGIYKANTNHLTGVHRRKGFDRCAKHCSAIDESLHDEVSHWFKNKKR